MARRVAVTGAGGQLGQQLVRLLAQRGDEVLALQRPAFDITAAQDLERLARLQPAVVINAAAWTDVDSCARDPGRAMRVNGEAPGRLAAIADRVNALIVQLSTNEVFDGERQAAYSEDDATRPINAYGESKLAGELAVAACTERHLIVRAAWIYGGPRSFPAKIRAAAERARAGGQALKVVADEYGNPTPASMLAGRIADLLSLPARKPLPKIVHLAGEPPVSRYEWAAWILGSSVAMEPIRQSDYERPSRPPRRAVLSTGLAAALGLEPISWRDHSA